MIVCPSLVTPSLSAIGAEYRRNGLVDELGGLWTAYQLAAKRAGLNPDKYDIDIIELPHQQSFDLSLLFGAYLDWT